MGKTKGGKGTLKFAILAVALVCQINTIASVMLSDIGAAFPGASNVAVQYVMQSGMIGAFVISFLMTMLTSRFRKKPMILMGLAAIFLGGLIPVINHSSILLLDICGFIGGAGQGFLTPLLGALILENFEGSDRDRMLGLSTTFITGGSALFLLIAGPVCETGWVNVYFIYFAALPILVIAQIFLAKDEKPQVRQAADRNTAPKVRIPAKGWIQCALIVMMGIGYCAFPLNLSLYVTGKGLGGAASVSMGMTMITVVGALVGLAFSPLVRASKFFVSPVAAVFGLIATLVTIFSQSLAMIFVGAALAGIYYGINTASPGYYIGRICTKEQYGPTYSMAMTCNFMGLILSPIILNLLIGLWGGDPNTPVNAFITGAGVFTVTLVLQIIWGIYLTRRQPSGEPAAAE